MGKLNTPKGKLVRKLGVNIFGNPKFDKLLSKKGYGPGQHGQSGKRFSTYAVQLKEKQKIKFMYGMLEKQFRNYFRKASQMKGETGLNLLVMLESRLDNVVYKLGFAPSRPSARQLVSHAHFMINGKKVNIGSYLVKEEDTVEVREKSKQLAIIDIALANKERETPEYIQLDEKNKKFKFVRTPKFEEVPYPVMMEPNLVIEYYSR